LRPAGGGLAVSAAVVVGPLATLVVVNLQGDVVGDRVGRTGASRKALQACRTTKKPRKTAAFTFD
jgi:hypothetical protein